MKGRSINIKSLVNLLRPENDLERALLAVPEFQIGLDWGEPRFGHPEGKVAYHIREVLDNVDQIKNLTPNERRRLRLITFRGTTVLLPAILCRILLQIRSYSILLPPTMMPITLGFMSARA